MVISNNPIPKLQEFSELVFKTNDYLNKDGIERPNYYLSRDGKKLETDVFEVRSTLAKGTPFDSSIELVSGQKFPDIVAKKYYGVEVKTSTKDHWITTGNSILESTRVEGVDRIFILFGKLCNPIAFKARPYEECLSDVVVTHYPRYKVDMDLPVGETIFDILKIPYDELRLLENPVLPIANFFKRNLKEGESLWWIDNSLIEEPVPLKIRLWSSLEKEEKENFKIIGLALFPEIFSANPKKYDRFILWLVARRGIVSTSMRDTFSAGGKVDLTANKHLYKDLPRVFEHISLYKERIVEVVNSMSNIELCNNWKVDRVDNNPMKTWIALVCKYTDLQKKTIRSIIPNEFQEEVSSYLVLNRIRGLLEDLFSRYI